MTKRAKKPTTPKHTWHCWDALMGQIFSLHSDDLKSIDLPGTRLPERYRPNKSQYNGKELHTDFGMNWYGYGARMYDAAVGRFFPDSFRVRVFRG